jgi:hypothetical protein
MCCLCPPLPDQIKFLAEEMALILSLDDNLFNDMTALDNLHNSAIALFGEYAKQRDALTNTLSPETMDGNVGLVYLNGAERDRIRPHSVELDMIIDGMLDLTINDGKTAWNCLERLHQALEKEFDLKHKLETNEQYKSSSPSAESDRQPYYHRYKG